MSPKILLVLSPPCRSRLLPFLETEEWEIDSTVGFQDAVRKLAESSYDLLLVDAELADGSWRNLLLFVQNSGLTCEMIVCSRHADHGLWAEVIQTGSYDLITEPFGRQQVTRIIRSALESHYMSRFSTAMPLLGTAALPARA